jgi:hypothetical protein
MWRCAWIPGVVLCMLVRLGPQDPSRVRDGTGHPCWNLKYTCSFRVVLLHTMALVYTPVGLDPWAVAMSFCWIVCVCCACVCCVCMCVLCV